jgi:hypothetical protein
MVTKPSKHEALKRGRSLIILQVYCFVLDMVTGIALDFPV